MSYEIPPVPEPESLEEFIKRQDQEIAALNHEVAQAHGVAQALELLYEKTKADNIHLRERIAAGARKFWGVELESFLIPFYSENGKQKPRSHSLDSPLPTIPASGGGKFGLVEPFLLQQQSGGAPRAVSQPAPTVATKGAISLVEPFLVKFYATATGAQSISDPLDTVTTRDRHGLVTNNHRPVTRPGRKPRLVEPPVETVIRRAA